MKVTVREGKVYDFALCVLYSEHTELELLTPAAKCNELWSKAGTFDVTVLYWKAPKKQQLFAACDEIRAHKYFHAQWVNYRPGGSLAGSSRGLFVVGARRRKAKNKQSRSPPRPSRRFRVTSTRASHYSSRWQLIGVTHFCSCAY